ncbi:MAG TPA: UbiA family prenyltransferase [Chitinophagales bacterium]|nr:UbiA family prenyltransferase [Chitinophagales bacterium]
MFIQPDISPSLPHNTSVLGPKVLELNHVSYRKLHYFHAAALSLFFCGVIISPEQSIIDLSISTWFVLCGVFMIYRFNDIIDHAHGFRFNSKKITGSPIHLLFIVQLICVATPLAWIYLSPFRLTLLSIIGVIGILYSVPLHFRGRVLRIKHTFLLKNISIGVLWGLLPSLGADHITTPLILGLTWFAIMQVTMGSVLRDIADRVHDKLFEVQTLPVRWGVSKTLFYAQIWNILSLTVFICICPEIYIAIAFLTPVIWRAWNIYKIGKSPDAARWTHTINLLTCAVIFIMFMVSQLYVGNL